MGLSKKYCVILLVLILIVILGTTLGILFGIGVIETGGGSSHHSSGGSGGKSCKISDPSGDVVVESSKFHQLECKDGLTSVYNLIKCVDGTFQDRRGNQINTELCGNTCNNLPTLKNGGTDSPTTVNHGSTITYKCDYGFSQQEFSFTCNDSVVVQFDADKDYCGSRKFKYVLNTENLRSWADSQAVCKNQGGNLWGTDEKLNTIAGRLSIIEGKGFPANYIWMGWTKKGDGETWRRVSDNSVINPDSPEDPFPKSEYQTSGYPVANAGYDYMMLYHNPGHAVHGKLINNPEYTGYYSVCEIPDNGDN